MSAFWLFISLCLSGDPEAGRRLYQQGLLFDGTPIVATSLGNPAVAASAFRCAACHRPSGYGGSEGGTYVPPITARALFASDEPSRLQQFRELYQEDRPAREWSKLRTGRLRPAYDETSLLQALHHGLDTAGRRLDPVMPRYQLGLRDSANLLAYLRTLSLAPAPGVDEETLQLATVFTPETNSDRQAAIAEVVAAFVKRKNAETAALRQRARFSPYYKDEFTPSWRLWVHRFWRLSGPAEQWPEQLARAWSDQPVFALISGLGEGDWSAVQAFCEAKQLPCLFPLVTQPPDAPNGQIFYFRDGPRAEAAFLADWLAAHGQGRALLQWGDPNGPAQAAMALLHARHQPRKTLGDMGEALLVAWQDASALAGTVNSWRGPLPRQVFLSGSLLGEARTKLALPAEWRSRTLILDPFGDSARIWPESHEVRSWLHARGLSTDHEGDRFDAWFALSALDHALTAMAGQFSTAYLLERIEHETERMPNPGHYPALSLAPGQRIASRQIRLVPPQ